MGAAKESPATQVLTWAVGKLDEASKIDWMEKLNSLTASKPAYLRNAVLTTTAPSHSAPTSAPAPERAPAPSGGGGISREHYEAALNRALQAETRADILAKRVDELESKLAGRNSHAEVDLQSEEDDHSKTHWWSRH
jgi:hypothetical protein